MNIVLIGYRGTGKSTVGRVVAKRLNYGFVDADEELERRAGQTIREIFARDGEVEFRRLESQLLSKLLVGSGQVLALGGGVVLSEQNRQMIKQPQQHVFWLKADPATLHRRIEADPLSSQRRPNLTAAGGSEEIVRLLAAREPLYRECAGCIIETEGKSPDQVASEIVSLASSSIRSPK